MHSSSIAALFSFVLAASVAASPVRSRADLASGSRAAPAADGFSYFARVAESKAKRAIQRRKGHNGGEGGKGQSGASASTLGATAAATIATSNATTAAAPPVNNAAGSGAPADPQGLQTSLTVDPSVICTDCTNDGNTPPSEGQSSSLTTTNNFINFCALTLSTTPITNGQQIITGSCNPTPMGLIPAKTQMPSAKFNFPKNQDVINANVPFNASLNIVNLQTGVFTNATSTYFAAPQQLNAQGQIIGHTHIVIEPLDSLTTVTPTDPTKFFFFKGVDAPAVNGEAIALVASGVPAGPYRMCSINTSANHAPLVVPVAQHGSLDDCVYFTAQ